MSSGIYHQVYLPNYNIPCVGGLCEGFVEGTVGQATLPYIEDGKWTTSGVWPTASYAWNNNYQRGNHPNELPPAGLISVVFFRLGNNPADHTALVLEDGRVASTTIPGYRNIPFIHPSLDNMISIYAKANGGCTYLGWSEYIGRVKIVEGDNMNTEEILRSALNASRNANEILQSALNAARKESEVFESALNAEREKTKQLEEELSKEGTVLTSGKYVVKG